MQANSKKGKDESAGRRTLTIKLHNFVSMPRFLLAQSTRVLIALLAVGSIYLLGVESGVVSDEKVEMHINCANTCVHARNGQCDDPRGNGLCPTGSAFVDLFLPTFRVLKLFFIGYRQGRIARIVGLLTQRPTLASVTTLGWKTIQETH